MENSNMAQSVNNFRIFQRANQTKPYKFLLKTDNKEGKKENE